jgi:hypothetical protein
MGRFSFWKSDDVKRVPEPVLQYMKRRFMLPTLYVTSLRCFEGDGSHQGERVTKLRIFSPTMAGSFGLTLKTSSDLDQHPEVLLFEGYIDRGGRVYVADRRSSAKRRPRETVGALTEDGGNGQGYGEHIPRARLASYGPGAGWPSGLIDEEEWS